MLLSHAGRLQSAERALKHPANSKAKTSDVERVKGELEGAMSDLQRAHDQLSKVRHVLPLLIF